jgi:hypothetical protein
MLCCFTRRQVTLQITRLRLTAGVSVLQTLSPMQEAWLEANSYPWCPDIWCAAPPVTPPCPAVLLRVAPT